MSVNSAPQRISLLLAVAGVVASCSPVPPPQLPDIYFSTVPDLPQEGPPFDAQYESEMLCAPVAVSNSLVWLQGNTALPSQINLVNKLAHYTYMGTSPNNGTSPAGVLQGVQKYLAESGHGYRSLQYAGVREVPLKYRATTPLTLKWLHAGLTPQSAVWLNLGWYTRVLPGYYRREGGHWVTLVGFREGELLVHDPGPWQDVLEPWQVRVQRNRLVDIGKWKFAPRSLEVQNFPAPQGGHTVIDGAVLLQLDP